MIWVFFLMSRMYWLAQSRQVMLLEGAGSARRDALRPKLLNDLQHPQESGRYHLLPVVSFGPFGISCSCLAFEGKRGLPGLPRPAADN